MSYRKKLVALVGLVGMLLAACGPTATSSPPTSASAAPTAAATPTPGASPMLGATPLPATATPSPKPAPTPTVVPLGPRVKGTVRLPQSNDPVTWDPAGATGNELSNTKYLVFSPLFTFWSDTDPSCQQKIYPLAAKDWRWLDDTTMEISVKAEIRFHGKPPVSSRLADAQDIVSSFERYSLPIMAASKAQVSSLTAVGKDTIRVKLAQPWGGLMTELLGHVHAPWIEAPEVRKEWWNDPAKSWIGTGPFVFDSWKPGVKWSLLRNQQYFLQGLPYLEQVEMLVMPDVSMQLAAMRSGHLTAIRDLAQPLLQTLLKAEPGITVLRCPGLQQSQSGALVMNTRGPPFDNALVRRAVSMAIDRQAMIDIIYQGAAAFTAIAPPTLAYALTVQDFPSELRQNLTYDPDRARQLLAQAGYASGFETVIITNSRYGPPTPQIAEMLVSMLDKVGIRAKLNLMEQGRFSATVLLQAQYPIGQVALTNGTALTPEHGNGYLVHSKYGGVYNRSMVSDPAYDALAERFITSLDEKERAELARQLQFRAAEMMYRIQLPMPDSTMIHWRSLHLSWHGNSNNYGMMLATAWME